jgi:hypothetical protein
MHTSKVKINFLVLHIFISKESTASDHANEQLPYSFIYSNIYT